MQDPKAGRLGQLAVALSASAAVILSSPFVGELRSAVLAAFPAQFRLIVGGAIATAVVAAAVVAIVRGAGWRVVGLAVALIGGALYAQLVSTGNPNVDAVEHVHFVEYGLVAWLFYEAWRPLDNGLVVIWPLIAGILTGIVDEFVQWYVPLRVGEAHDIFLNAVAVACGLCFAASIDPPSRFAVPLHRRVIRPVAYGVAAVILAFAVFFQAVHLGHRLFRPELGMFWSTYDDAALRAASRDRATRWKSDPPSVLHRLSREDQYLSEGLWHVQERNRAWGVRDVFTAWRENMILETYFAPVLDTATYDTPMPPRWPAAQRAQAAAIVGPDPGFYMSRAAPYPIYTWSSWAFWIVVAATIAAVVTAC
jgi:hypothetical protein